MKFMEQIEFEFTPDILLNDSFKPLKQHFQKNKSNSSNKKGASTVTQDDYVDDE